MNKYGIENIFESIPGHIYWIDKNNIFLGCNDLQAVDLGLKSRHEIIGKSLYDLHPKSTAELIEKNNSVVIESGLPQTFEEEIIQKEGDDVSVWLSHKVPLKEDGKIMGVIGISSNMTSVREKQQSIQQRKDKENKHEVAKLVSQITGKSLRSEIEPIEHIKQMRDYFENLIAFMPGHVYWLNREGIYLGCNDLQAKSAGLNSRHEIVGKTNAELPWNLNKGLLPEHLDNANTQVLESGQSLTIEEPAYDKDGNMRTFFSTKVPLFDNEKNVTGVLGISMDITAQKEVQQLKFEKKSMQKRIETIELIAASIAHELRTPLRTISSGAHGLRKYLPLLLDTYTKADDAGLDVPHISRLHMKTLGTLTDSIINESQSAFTVIDVLLMKAGLLKIDTKRFATNSMAQVLKESVERYHLAQDEKDLIKISPCDFTFLGDKLLLIHVLFNLYKNAIYYIKACGKGEITLWCEHGEESNTLFVKDTGAGIKPEYLPHVFDRFFTKTSHGTGVGLSFCKMVMQSFGGDISCESVYGEYTLFTLRFPKYQA